MLASGPCRILTHTFLDDHAPTLYGRHESIYQQGDNADSVFRLENGLVKLTIVAPSGKEAVIAIVQKGEFFGEGCLVMDAAERTHSAVALSDSRVSRFSTRAILHRLQADSAFSAEFNRHLIARNMRYEADLADQLSNSSEKRLARLLLLLSRGKNGPTRIDQQTLAEMVGTTRSRVCFFMNKFRRLGFIDYSDGLEVRQSLEQVIQAE